MARPASNSARSRACGLLVRRERWSFTWKGWLVVLAAVAGLIFFAVARIHPFLACTDRVNTDVLVVEGWIPKSSIVAAAVEFTNGRYRRLFTTGGPVSGSGPEKNPYNTSASIGASRLRAAGVPSDAIQVVPSFVKDRDRTYSAALALREWLQRNEPTIKRVNVLTEGVHARRSRLLFQKALGDDFQVGIIAVPNSDYDANRWWRYSEGVKEIISEGAAYLYVRLFFSPDLKGAQASRLSSLASRQTLLLSDEQFVTRH
jgi:uncharacterized SAM-binding protein YcdF (DUF218 family)